MGIQFAFMSLLLTKNHKSLKKNENNDNKNILKNKNTTWVIRVNVHFIQLGTIMVCSFSTHRYHSRVFFKNTNLSNRRIYRPENYIACS
jgi:hypothetical protein